MSLAIAVSNNPIGSKYCFDPDYANDNGLLGAIPELPLYFPSNAEFVTQIQEDVQERVKDAGYKADLGGKLAQIRHIIDHNGDANRLRNLIDEHTAAVDRHPLNQSAYKAFGTVHLFYNQNPTPPMGEFAGLMAGLLKGNISNGIGARMSAGLAQVFRFGLNAGYDFVKNMRYETLKLKAQDGNLSKAEAKALDDLHYDNLLGKEAQGKLTSEDIDFLNAKRAEMNTRDNAQTQAREAQRQEEQRQADLNAQAIRQEEGRARAAEREAARSRQAEQEQQRQRAADQQQPPANPTSTKLPGDDPARNNPAPMDERQETKQPMTELEQKQSDIRDVQIFLTKEKVHKDIINAFGDPKVAEALSDSIAESTMTPIEKFVKNTQKLHDTVVKETGSKILGEVAVVARVTNNVVGAVVENVVAPFVNAATKIELPGDGLVQMGRYAMTTDSITPQGLGEASKGMGYVTDPQTGEKIRGTGVIGSALDTVGYAMHTVQSGIGMGIEKVSGSKAFADELAPVAMLFVPGAAAKVTNVAKAAASVARTGRFGNPATMSFFEAEAAANAAANASKISHTQVLSNVIHMPVQPKAVSFANNAKVTSSAPAMEVTPTLKVSQTGPSISAQVSTSTTPSLFGKAESYSGAQATFGNNFRSAPTQQATWRTVAREAAARSTVSRAGYTTSTTSYGPMSNNAAFTRAASSIEVMPTLKVGGNPGKISHNPLDNVTKISHSEVSISAKVGSYSEAQSTFGNSVKLDAAQQTALRDIVAKEAAEAARVNKAPYSPHPWRDHLQNAYPGETVTNHTVLRPGDRGFSFAEGTHPKTGVHMTARGPDFGDAVMTEARLTNPLHLEKSEIFQMREATRQIRSAFESGKITEAQLEKWASKHYEIKGEIPTSTALNEAVQTIKNNIISGEPKIWEFTWHHHIESGRLQLVPEKLHSKTGHVGVEKWNSPESILKGEK